MEALKRNINPIRMRNYGRILQDIITYACTLPDLEQKKELTIYIGQCMRQKNIAWNKDQEAGVARVKEDIARLSNGLLTTEIEGFDEAVSKNLMGMNKKKKK